MSKIVSANELATGFVVFRNASGGWVKAIGEAEVLEDPAAIETALAAAKDDERRAVIVDPFVVDRAEKTKNGAAMTLRNSIRAFGPTIAYRPATARDV